jgi:hypothetical protein
LPQRIGGAFDASSLSEGISRAMSEIEKLNACYLEKLGS